jgi:hypothetical protein
MISQEFMLFLPKKDLTVFSKYEIIIFWKIRTLRIKYSGLKMKPILFWFEYVKHFTTDIRQPYFSAENAA